MTTPWTVAFVALAFVVLAEGVYLLGLTRRIIGVLEQAESRLRDLPNFGVGGVAPGTTLPLFEVVDETGQTVSSRDLLGVSRVFVFLSSTCAPCRELADAMRRDSGLGHASRPVHVVVESSGHGRDLGLIGLVSLLEDVGGSTARAFQNRAKPQAFLVDADGVVVASSVSNRLEEVHEFAERLLGGDTDRRLDLDVQALS